MSYSFLLKNFIFTLLLFCTLTGFSANLTVKAPAVVNLGETFQISYVANAVPDRFFMPSFTDFRVIAGPTQYSSKSLINGQRTDVATLTYYVEATKEGVFYVPKAEMLVNGQQIQSESFKIEVVAANVNSNQANSSGGKPNTSSGNNTSSGTSSTNSKSTTNNDIFTRFEFSKTSLYKGEAVLATVKIYTQVGIADLTDFKVPQLTGFYSLDMDLAEGENSFKRVNLDGKVYNCAILKRYLLFPQRSGKLAVEPVEFNVSIQVPRPRQARSLFDDFFDSPYDVRKQVLRTGKVVLDVKDLPAGAPASFSGAVGSNFKIDLKLDKKQVVANQAIACSLDLSGTGNLKLIDQPIVDFPHDFDKYDPKVTENIRSTFNGMVGSKKYEFALIPRSAGVFEIQGTSFTYFDPAQAKYITLKSDDLQVTVDRDPNANNAQSSTILPPNQQSVRHLGRDILFIKTTPQKFHPHAAIFFGSISFYLIILLTMVLLALVLVLIRKRTKDAQDHSKVRNKNANKMAISRLRNAKKCLNAGDSKAFYTEISKGVWGYISDKFTIPVAELSRNNVQDSLSARGVSSEVSTALIQLIDECEFAQYAPTSNQQTLLHIYDQAIELISQLEKNA